MAYDLYCIVLIMFKKTYTLTKNKKIVFFFFNSEGLHLSYEFNIIKRNDSKLVNKPNKIKEKI